MTSISSYYWCWIFANFKIIRELKYKKYRICSNFYKIFTMILINTLIFKQKIPTVLVSIVADIKIILTCFELVIKSRRTIISKKSMS